MRVKRKEREREGERNNAWKKKKELLSLFMVAQQ